MKNYKNKILILIIFSFFSALVFDFIKFYKNIFLFENNQKPNSHLVVLTGGTNRIKQTLDVFFNQYSTKYQLLISGAGKGFNKNIVSNFLPKNELSRKTVSCCIHIESKSTNTRSNAIETLKWVNKNDISSFTLITSDYHMQRALVEFKIIFKNTIINPYVLKTKNNNIDRVYKIYLLEYLKFLIAKLRFF